MHLPVPRPEDVDAFRKLVLNEFGLELTEGEAEELACRVLHLYYVQNYGVDPLCPVRPPATPYPRKAPGRRKRPEGTSS